jgi:hypothetical protein
LPEAQADIVFGERVRLLQYAYPESGLVAGETLHIVLIWQSVTHLDFDYSVFVHLMDSGGQVYRQADGSPVGGLHAMSTWTEDEIVVDRYGFLLSEDAQPGTYRLLVGIYRWDTMERLSISDPDGNLDAFELGTVNVKAVQ